MRQKFNREPYEDKIWEFLKKSRQVLETFTDWDYYLAGANAIWNHAAVLLKKLPNYRLIEICEKIDHEDQYDSYYKIFE